MAALLTRRLHARGHELLFLCRPVCPALPDIPSGVEIAPLQGGTDWSPLPDVMAALDILVYPSVMEGFGLAAVEGMASSLPVVVARAGSLPEIVGEEGAGLFVPAHDATTLAEAIEALARDSGRRETMAHRGRSRVEEKFDLERMADRYEGILRNAILAA